MESFQIYLNSKYADKYYNNNISDALYTLPFIEVPDGHYIYVSVLDATIPYSFYNISSENNYFEYLINGNTYSFYLKIGNYNISQLVNAFNSSNSNIVAVYDDLTNKIKFSNQLYNFTFKSTSTLLNILGFDYQNITSYGNFLFSQNCINLQTTQRINISSNFVTYNINKVSKIIHNSSILCSIPVITSPFSLIHYTNTTFKSNTFLNSLNEISNRRSRRKINQS